MKTSALTILSLFIMAGVSFAQTETPTLLQKPAINDAQIVFVYAGDLWTVPREGGDAKRLTTGVGTETNPIFSPDGRTIAFTGEYDGNTDIYIVPATGGVPKRLTYHPGGDIVCGWTNDGKRVLFASGRNSHSGFPRLFTVGLDGSFPEEVPLPMAERGAFSPDGAYLAYEPLTQWQPDWKRYQGGQQDVIWIAKLSDSSIEKLPREKSNDRYPMWIGDKIYFLSDRNGGYSLFAFDTKSKKVTELVKNNGLDIKSATASAGGGPSVIAYEQFGSIHLYDIKTNKSRKVNIRVAADVTTVRPRFERVGDRIFNANISPTGARAVFEARGEIITVPAEKGDPRNLTNTTGVMERNPSWSPDGKWIAYFSDESGEYALHLRDQKGAGEVKKIALPPTFYNTPTWSPDSKKIAVYDKKLQLWYLEIDKGSPVKVDNNPIGFDNAVMNPNWSPDSRWIAYTKQLPNLLRAVFVYSLETGKTHQITDGFSDARYPAFDMSGKYLYFTASTDIGPGISFAELSGFGYRSTRSVYAAVLRNDIPSPLAPESDEEKVTEEKKEGETGGQGDKEKAGQGEGAKPADKPEEKKADAPAPAGAPRLPAKKEEPTRIDLEGIDQRIIALPIPARDYAGLTVGKANNIYILEQPIAPAAPGQFGLTVHKYDLEKRKLDQALAGVTAFEISANGEKVLYRQGSSSWMIKPLAALGAPMGPVAPGAGPGAPGGPGAGPGGSGILRTSEMEVYVDPKVEWKQMYNEAWRNERDFFYDKNLHGLNLEEMKKRYAPYVEAVAHRSDLNYLFTEMLNQLTVGHMFIGGGDQPRPNFVPGGLLGCDYKIENGRYRFAKIYNGENWNPNLRAPLTQPGVNVKEGEYLLAVGGRNLTAADNVYSFFESKANKQIVIKVGPNPDGSNAREVTVVPVGNEQGLRNLAWIEGNRRKVDQLSGGKLAYIYLPNTGGGGYTSFNRYFFSQTNKDGAVIDERFNGGGALADYVVQHLSRQHLSMIHFREGSQDVPVPAGAIYGPKAMIINEMAGSGGDAMPWFFRKMKLGPLVGKRTWGGLVASFRPPPLMDGGGHTAPDAAVYGLNGEWEVENAGVGPDIEVEFDPAAWRQGRDPQLERTVEYLLEELKKNPRPQIKRPAFPNYHQSNPVVTTGQAGRTGQ
ncbi:MAG TPA: PDZ domain-containing protein [Blastocatellia bacterium]|nr:PDZ domain-containing protein [Blastocatellia bacterium]